MLNNVLIGVALAAMLGGCGVNRMAVRDAEAYGRLRVDRTDDHNFTVTIQRRGIFANPDPNDPKVRLDYVKSALDCPSATILNETVVPRGSIAGTPEKDYVLNVRC